MNRPLVPVGTEASRLGRFLSMRGVRDSDTKIRSRQVASGDNLNTDEVEKKLIAYITATSNARPTVSQLHGLEITSLDIQNALSSVLGVDDMNPAELLDKNLTADRIVELLRSFDFGKYHPEIIVEIELEEGIIPDGTARLLTEKTVKVKGEVWAVHKNDADPWPSNPHAHSYDAGLKLHLGTGELYDGNRKLVGQIGKKKLKAVRNKLGNIKLPKLVK